MNDDWRNLEQLACWRNARTGRIIRVFASYKVMLDTDGAILSRLTRSEVATLDDIGWAARPSDNWEEAK